METYLFLENKQKIQILFSYETEQGLKKQKFLQLYFWVLPF